MTDNQRTFHMVMAWVLGFIMVGTIIADGFGIWFVLALTACVANVMMPYEYARRRR